MSRYFIFGDEFMGCSLAWRLQELEQEDVRVFSKTKPGREHLRGMVEHVGSMGDGLRWCGSHGVVICDDEQDCSELRRAGFSVVGGNAYTQRLERDRVFQSEQARAAGIPIPDFHECKSVDEAISYVKDNPDAYCLKQLGHAPKEWNYVGKDDSGEDVLMQLDWIKRQPLFKEMGGKLPFMLQEVVDGFEFAVGAFWLGHDWLRNDTGDVLVELNREHKKMLNGDLGISSGEMGTVLAFTGGGKLFDMMLDPLTPVLLRECPDVALNIDANCGIVSEDEAYLYELTPRMGYPAHSLHEQLFAGSCGEFYTALAQQRQAELDYQPSWCVGTCLGAGDYPHESIEERSQSFKDQPVTIDLNENVLPEYLKDERGSIRISDKYPWCSVVTFVDPEIAVANDNCVAEMQKVIVRAPVFRTDIGESFRNDELPQLIEWGYVPDELAQPGYHGVDFDATIAKETNNGHLGEPVKPMVDRVKNWLSNGESVRIITARMDKNEEIKDWLSQHVGQPLMVTNRKDHDLIDLFDDKAVGVVPNEGVPV